ncbi:ATP-binding cassette domain-containing protein [Aureitalea marina]|uniref:ABC transporter domain-containing protein n=1 Tax=Aureitalea marina TaxID=930804 RepID=A0A2S7KPR4_9FLAO|nr:ATP-binding cassette domain-containing protein [Aureitalea marina]PQB04619.1 hypothetical protein BST85_06705 [Aureitalea marina]
MVFELRHISKSYGSRAILNSVSLQVDTGEVIGIFGRNGCGKTTLFQCIAGQISSSISIVVDGESVHPKNLLLNGILGYVPQQPFLPAHVKIRDLIPLYLKEEADQDLLYYDPILSGLMNNRPGELSIGERKITELLLVGNLRRPVLILDEPFTMLEPIQIERAKELILQWASHSAILISDHYYREVEAITDRNMVLEEGIGHWIRDQSDWNKFDYRID